MKKLTIAFLLAAASTSVFAQSARENGFYAVVTTGPTTFNFPNGNSLKSNSYQFGVGYDINKYLAAEITYGSLYKLAATGSNNYAESITGTNFSVLALYPIDNFSPYVKLGVTSVDVELKYSTGSYTEKNSIYVYGVGTEVKLDQRTSVRVEYAASQKKAGYTDANYIQAGVIVRF